MLPSTRAVSPVVNAPACFPYRSYRLKFLQISHYVTYFDIVTFMPPKTTLASIVLLDAANRQSNDQHT